MRLNVLLVAALGSAATAYGQPPATVRVDPARLEVIEQRRPVTGRLVAARRSVVAAEEPGIVIRVAVREGDEVEKGQIIAVLDSARALIALSRAEADHAADEALVRQRAAVLELAERELQRRELAADLSSASEQETDNARSVRDSAKAGHEQAIALSASSKHEVALVKERLDDLTILAPFAGAIVSKRTEIGEWIGAGEPVVELVDLDSIEAVLDVPERFVNRLGMTDASVQIKIRAIDEIMEGPITRIVPLADELSRMFPVRVVLDNKSRRLRPGMSVIGLIPTGANVETLTVHKDAIMRDAAGEFVYFNTNGTAAAARVGILFGAGDRVAITSRQLGPGVGVIIEGNELLFPGQSLVVVPHVAPTSAAGAGDGLGEGRGG